MSDERLAEHSGTAPSSVDAAVAARLAEGDVRAAAEDALRGLGPHVLRFLRSALRDEGMAGDAFSLFAEELWHGLAGFRGCSSVRTWAFRIAKHAALRVRADRWRKRRVPLSQGPGSLIAERVRSATPLVVEQRSRALDALRDRLSLRDRTLLALRVDQRLSWAEIAEVFAHREGRVEIAALQKRFQRMAQKLATLAAEEGLLER